LQNVRGEYLKLSFFPWAFILVGIIVFRYFPEYLAHVFLANVWLCSYTHNISTYFCGDLRPKISSKYVLLNFLIFFIFCLGTYKLAGMVVLFSIYFYWQWFHYLRQNFGLYCLSDKKKKTSQLSRYIYHVQGILALFLLWAKGDLDFFGFMIYGLSIDHIVPVIYFKLAFILLSLIVIFLEKSNKKRIVLATHFSMYFLCFSLLSNFLEGWLYLNIHHNISYLIAVWQRRSKQGLGEGSLLKKALNHPLSFYLIILSISSTIFYTLSLSMNLYVFGVYHWPLVIGLSINFLHYFLDGLIWKSSFVNKKPDFFTKTSPSI